MPKDNKFRQDILQTTIAVERANLKRGLASQIKNLSRELARAAENLENDRPIEAGLMQGSNDISANVSRWNLILWLTPLVKGDA